QLRLQLHLQLRLQLQLRLHLQLQLRMRLWLWLWLRLWLWLGMRMRLWQRLRLQLRWRWRLQLQLRLPLRLQLRLPLRLRGLLRLAATSHTQFGKVIDHVLGRSLGPDIGIDLHDLAILINIKGVASRVSFVMKHAVGTGDRLAFVTQQRKIRPRLSREALGVEQWIDAGHEIRHIKLADAVSVFGQRFAFYGATIGIRFGEPRQHDG